MANGNRTQYILTGSKTIPSNAPLPHSTRRVRVVYERRKHTLCVNKLIIHIYNLALCVRCTGTEEMLVSTVSQGVRPRAAQSPEPAYKRGSVSVQHACRGGRLVQTLLCPSCHSLHLDDGWLWRLLVNTAGQRNATAKQWRALTLVME